MDVRPGKRVWDASPMEGGAKQRRQTAGDGREVARGAGAGLGGGLRSEPHDAVVQPIERVDVRLRRRHDDVGVGAEPVDDAAVPLESHRHFALRIGAAGNCIHRIEQKP